MKADKAIREFTMNFSEKVVLQNKQVFRHPKFKKRKWVLVLLAIFDLYVGIWFGALFPAGIERIIYFFAGLLVPGFAPLLLYFCALGKTCQEGVPFKHHERISVRENEIAHIFHWNDEAYDEAFDEHICKYTDITKLVRNTYHNRIDIYGKVYHSTYEDINIGDCSQPVYLPRMYKIRIYLYYYDSEEMVELIREKTGLEYEIKDYPEV